MSAGEPISAVEALALLARALRGTSGRAVAGSVMLAVSGGPDSMAMLWLAARCRRDLGVGMTVATVDHGLRDAAAAEAAAVAQVCRTLDLPHRVLRWEGAKPAANLQATARRARYRLLEDAAVAAGASVVLTAHHEDDQIETHELAEARRAGDRGLAGMRGRRALGPGLDLVRPFLSVPGRRLRRTAEASGLPVVDDPSNRDPRFDRVRLRLAAAGRSEAERAARLAAIERHRTATSIADAAIAAALGGEEGACVDPLGRVGLATDRLRDLAPGHRSDLLGRILVAVAGADHAPDRPALERLSDRSIGGGAQASTLGGVRIEGGATLLFRREYGRTGPASLPFPDPNGSVLFDGRHRVEWTGGASPDAPAAGACLVPFGRLGRGPAAERTLPVLIGANGSVLAVPDLLAHRVSGVAGRLLLTPRVAWRLWSDLPRDDTA